MLIAISGAHLKKFTKTPTSSREVSKYLNLALGRFVELPSAHEKSKYVRNLA